MEEQQPDEDLKEAMEACSKIIEEKCKKRPYMLIISKADIRFESEEDAKKGIVKGKASYMYMAKPPLKQTGLSKILLGASKKALEMAEEQIKSSTES